ncbi:unnamed protein product [Caenorhabditis angaria]|uniref:DNA replication complex GINS protein PSF1 n=1 Tax=Caenorhabditis angaria TaxID=860376 RepID=A0A9P1I315_9PELO|nr:unnamed protein product [Caenorhabditis angaria]
MSEGDPIDHTLLQPRIAAMNYIENFLCDYLNARKYRIRSFRLIYGEDLPSSIRNALCEAETFFNQYSSALATLQGNLGSNCVNFLLLVEPPKSSFVHVRLLENYGDFEIPDGTLVVSMNYISGVMSSREINNGCDRKRRIHSYGEKENCEEEEETLKTSQKEVKSAKIRKMFESEEEVGESFENDFESQRNDGAIYDDIDDVDTVGKLENVRIDMMEDIEVDMMEQNETVDLMEHDEKFPMNEIIEQSKRSNVPKIGEKNTNLDHDDNYLQMLLSNDQSLEEAFQDFKTNAPTNTIEKLLSTKTVSVEEKLKLIEQLKKSNDELNSIKNKAYGELKKLRLILSDKLYDNLRPLWLIEEDTGLKDIIVAISKDFLISVDLLRAIGGIFDKNGKDEVLKYLKRLDGNRKSADNYKEIQKKKKEEKGKKDK